VSGIVRTVLGDVSPESLGITLIHEHLFMDATAMLGVHGYQSDIEIAKFTIADAAECRWNPGAHSHNYALTDVAAVISDLHAARGDGVRTVVDVTPIDMGRAPAQLRDIAAATGLHVIMGTGYYLRGTHRAHLRDEAIDDQVFDRILHEHESGSDGSKPGIIGEIGTGDPPDAAELAVLRGAARAAAASGLALSVHVHPWGWTAPELLNVITSTDVDPTRVILGHMNTAIERPAYLLALLAEGVTLGFDLFGFDHSLLTVGRYPPSDWEVARTVADLVAAGWVDQLVLSHDIGVRTRLRAFGGWGYSHLLTHIVPILRDLGVPADGITTMVEANPRRLLTLAGAGNPR